MTTYTATFMHPSISRAREITVTGTLEQAKVVSGMSVPPLWLRRVDRSRGFPRVSHALVDIRGPLGCSGQQAQLAQMS